MTCCHWNYTQTTGRVKAMTLPELQDSATYLLRGGRYLCRIGGDVITLTELDSADPVELLVIRRSGVLLILRSPVGRYWDLPLTVADLTKEQ
jgi:hypothetical protein